MWKEQNHAPKGHRNFGDEWGRLSVTMKKAEPFSFSLLLDNHFLEYDGVRILYSSLLNQNFERKSPVQIHQAPSIPLRKLIETFRVLCKQIDPKVIDFVLAKIKEPRCIL